MKPPPRLPLDALAAGERWLDRAALHYLVRVQRLRPGDRFVAFDPGSATEADAELVTLEAGRGLVRCAPPQRARLCPVRTLVVIQGCAKGDKLDAVVRDATELGATHFAPALTARVQRRPNERVAERLRRVALEAARQCGRGDAPEVAEPTPLADVLARFAPCDDARLGLWLEPSATQRLSHFADALARVAWLAIAVGPEGGFTAEERAGARAHGFHEVALTPLTLRTETACAAALGGVAALGFSSFAP